MLNQSQRAALYFIGPASLFVGLILIFPVAYSFFLSVIDANNLAFFSGTTEFVGLRNFSELMSDDAFWNSLWLHSVFIVITTSVELVIALCVAIYLDQIVQIPRSLQTLLILPMFVIPIVSGLGFRYIFDPENGVWGQMFYMFDMQAPDLLGDPFWAMGVVIVQDVWRMWPFLFLIIFAGLQSISKEMQEAMKMDGANFFQLVRYLILPALKPTIFIACVLKVIESLKAFTEIYVMTGGGPGESTSILSMYIVKQVTEFSKFSTGSAASLVLFLVGMLMTYVVGLLYRSNSSKPLS